MKVYRTNHGFETVFDSDEYVEIEAEGRDKKSLMALRVIPSAYKQQFVACFCLS